jgi:hypothetical protein
MVSATLFAGCLSTANNDYLYSCANGGSCPTGSGCGGDQLCHPVFVAGAGPADAGSYLCANASPECPPGQSCGANNLCVAGDGGNVGLPDAGDAGNVIPDGGDGGSSSCNLATAFGSSAPVACGTNCAGLAIGDFNRDGYADIVVAVDPDNSNKGGLAVLLNDGTGNFGEPKVTRTLYNCGTDPDFPEYTSPDAFAVADFNGDGWPDLGLSLQESSQLALALNDQNGGFTVGGFQPATSNPNCGPSSGYSEITTYQSGGDWYLAAFGYGLSDSDGNSVVALSRVQSNAQGLDTFAVLEPDSNFAPEGITVGLFAGDSLPSALVTEENLDTEGGEIDLFSGSSSGSLDRLSSPPSQTLICQEGPARIVNADLDGDGLLDLIVVNDASDTVEVFYAKSGGFRSGVSFPVDVSTDTSDAGAQPVGVAVADMDGDGRADIATVNAAGSISILKGLTDGGFLLVAMKQTTSEVPVWISAVDLEDHGVNDGGIPDLVVSYESGAESSAVDVFHNNCR